MNTPPTPVDTRKILIFRFGGVGDYVHLLPFIEDLKSLYTDSEIHVLCGPSGKELIENTGLVDKCIVAHKLSRQGLESVSLTDLFHIRAQLTNPYDIYIDAVSKYSQAGAIKPRLVKFLASPRFSIGLDYLGRGAFHDLPIPEDRNAPKHNIARYGDILTGLGGKFEFHLPHIHLTAEMTAKAGEFAGDTPLPIIGFHPGANPKYVTARSWPAERFAALAERISANVPCRLVMTGSTHEQELLQSIQKRASVDIDLVPPTASVVQLCAYLQHMDLYISNDTGPMHLAVTMGVPTVGIFGHSDYESYGTYPESIPFEAIALDLGEKNPPYAKGDDPRGLRNISVDTVFDHFNTLREKVRGTNQ